MEQYQKMQSILLLMRFEGECLIERRGLQGRWVILMLILGYSGDDLQFHGEYYSSYYENRLTMIIINQALAIQLSHIHIDQYRLQISKMMRRIVKSMRPSFFNEKTISSEAMFDRSGLPKGSSFGDYMGLSVELMRLRKENDKEEKAQVRDYSGLLSIFFLGIGCACFIILYDAPFRIKAKLYYKQLQLLLIRKEKLQLDIINSYLTDIQEFLKKYPYEYKMILSQLKHMVVNFTQAIYPFHHKIVWICEMIVVNNKESKINEQWLQTMQKVLERSILKGYQIKMSLIHVILQNGNLKQMYLTVRYLSKKNIIFQGNTDTIGQHLLSEITKQKQYNNTIFNTNRQKKIQDLPQIAFKMQLHSQWLQYIKQYLHLSV